MYIICKEVEVHAAHFLKLDYKSKCNNLHGHSYKFKIWCAANNLNDMGMVVDYTRIKEIVNEFDHNCINDIPYFKEQGINTTTEHLCYYISQKLPNIIKVEAWESPHNHCIYINTNHSEYAELKYMLGAMV